MRATATIDLQCRDVGSWDNYSPAVLVLVLKTATVHVDRGGGGCRCPLNEGW